MSRIPRGLEAKLDPQLARRLEDAADSEPVRAIVKLGSLAPATPKQKPSPREFASREDYRRALIAQRRQEVESHDHGFLQQALGLGLDVKGEGLLRMVIVEGAAREVIAVLEHEAVESASLDREVEVEL